LLETDTWWDDGKEDIENLVSSLEVTLVQNKLEEKLRRRS